MNRAPLAHRSRPERLVRRLGRLGVAAWVGLVGFGVLTVPGAAVDLVDTTVPSQAVYPPSSYPVRVAHGFHAETFACSVCHAGVERSTHSAENLLPRMEVCGGCHPETNDTEDPQACAYCHPGYRPVWPEGEGYLAVRDPRFPLVGPEPVVTARPNLIFGHQGHADELCDTCHPMEADGGAVLPHEAVCLDCHRARGAAAMCGDCHPTGEDGRLATALPGNRLAPTLLLRPRDHDGDWAATHSLAAASDAALCTTCHDDGDCLGCHDGGLAVDSRHPPGFLNHHAFEARRGEPDCSACHSASSFCVDCHVDAGVLADDTHRPPPGVQVHPSGWLGPGGGDHRGAAQRNLLECASCHVESDCARCHAFVDPHGPAFFSRCGELLTANPRVCLRCHESTEPLERGCR